MLVKARATKEIFHRDDFYIIAFVPFTPYPSELQLSEYMNFTCKGALGWVTIGQDYEMDIDFVEYRRKADNKTVRRNVTLPNWLNQEAEKAHLNVSKVLQEALMSKLGVYR